MTEKIIREREVTVALPNSRPHTIKQKVIRVKPEMWIDSEHRIWYDVTEPVLTAWANGQEARLVKDESKKYRRNLRRHKSRNL